MIEKKVLKAGVAKRKISACAKKGGYDIDLMDYTEMEEAAAQALAECSFALDLRNLQSLTDEAAEYLTKHKKSINLESVVELTEKAAKHLAQKQSFIALGMTTLSTELAQIFSEAIAKIKWIKLTSLDGSDGNLALAQHLKSSNMIIHCHTLRRENVDERILKEIPDFKG